MIAALVGRSLLAAATAIFVSISSSLDISGSGSRSHVCDLQH